MDNYTLTTLIEKFKTGDMTVFPPLFSNFEGLIKLYSDRVNGEDAFQELVLFLIELFYKIDLSPFPKTDENGLNRYIAVALRNEYIKIARKYDCIKKESNPYSNDKDCPTTEFADNTLLREALDVLTPKQRKTVIYKYIYNLSDREIAALLRVTRQAVHKTNARAVNTLRAYYLGEI